MSYLLGIDVGTTRTAAAVSRLGARAGEIEMVNLGDGGACVPSVLFVAPDGSVVVGDAAQRRALTDPDRVVREFKRRVGDPTPVVVAGRAWAAEELSARLVRWVVDRVAEREGGPAAGIAVTHPASWGEHKRRLLAAALAGVGLEVSFLAEPQAAAVHYAAAERVPVGSTVAVYDLGGGTFDAAVVRKEGSGFVLQGRPEGIERLGGVDFDELVFEHVREGLPGVFEGLDDADPAVWAAVAALRRECVEAKEALSADTEVSIPVLLAGSRGSVRLHRSEFEGLIRSRVESTVEALRRAVSSAGTAPGQLTAVVLVGGSSRIPLVAQLVSEQLGRPVAVDADPKNAIAKGAALALTPSRVAGAVPAQRASSPAELGPARATAAVGHAGAPAAVGYAGAPAAAGYAGAPAAVGYAGAPAAAGYAGAPTTAGYAGTTATEGSRALDRRPRPGTALDPARRATALAPPRPAPTSWQQPPVDVDDHHARPGRSPAVLVGAGGLAAAVAVVAALFLLPSGMFGSDTGSRGQLPAPVATTPAVPPAPGTAPKDPVPPVTTSQAPPVVTTSAPPPPVSTPPSASTTPAPTSAPTTTSAPDTTTSPPTTTTSPTSATSATGPGDEAQ